MSMSFLNFRQAKRKAKKIVSIRRSLRPPTPPSPGSFGTTEVVDIVDTSGTSAEKYSPLADVHITPEPLFPNDTLLSTFRDHGWTTTPRQSRDRLSRSKQYRSSSRLLPQDGTGSVRSKDGRSSGSIVVGDVTSTPGSRRAARVTPAPIKIPSAHASRVQIRRSARKSADPHPPSTYPGESPIVDDGASAISGITLPGTLIANVWTLHTDQPRDHRVSRRITRMDSATLPAGDNPFTGSLARNSSRLSNRDNGNSLVPPMPPLPAGVNSAATSRPTSEPGKGDTALGDSVPPNLQSSSRDESSQETTDVQVFSSCESSQISPIAEPTAAEASGSGTPDLIKDSPTSADGGSSDAQPETSPSEFTPSAWSGPASGSPPPSGQEITMVLDAFPPLPSQAGGIIDECNLDEDVGSRKLRTASRRTSAGPKIRHSRRSLSSSRPSLASVNTLLLHPATLHPIGEQQISSTRSASEPSVGSQGAALDDAAALAALRSSLSALLPHHVPLLPSPPQSPGHLCAPTGLGLSTSLGSPSPLPSPDLLDHIVLDESSVRRRERHTSSESAPMMPVSGNGQTFPETPPAFSPMFSPGGNHPQGHTLSSGDSSVQRQPSVAQSLRGHGSRPSLKTVVGRSASVGMGMKARRKSLWNKLKRSPASNGPPLRSSLSTVTNDGAATTTKSDQILSGDGLPSRPRSVPDENSVDHPSSRNPALSDHSELQRKTIIPPTPLGLPPPPPSSSSLSSSLSLPPPPPPPKLHAPAPPFAHVSAASASSLPPPYEPLLSTAPDDALGAPSVNPPPNGSDRPPRPLGPRALRNSSSSPNSRERILSHGSAASLSRVTLMGARELVSGGSTSLSGPNSSSGPRFRTSPPKFKALTMEGAKWTFSSEELQEIVSQAIKQSGRSSSIRLSSLQEASVEIPEELERLDALMHELGVQYRLQVRKRDVLLRAAYACTESPESSSIVLRAKLQELHETSVNLDRIAEDLYHARDQAAQISRMLTVHSRSALAMALRKLHSSFLKRTAEVDTLKDRVATLEAERDEAWAQAQEVARDLDALNDTIQSRASTPCLTRSTSRRSSRVMASRKSSLRVSKAGLRLSQRASTASQIGSAPLSYVSALSSPSSASGYIPPVPPIPRRLPSLNHINTSDLLMPSRNSVHASDLSSSSGRRALAQAQAELYGYLGIDDPEVMPPLPRRSSVAASPSPSTVSPVARDKARRRMSDITDRRITRGSGSGGSIGGGGLSDRFRAYAENEPAAMLATFNLLDS